MEATIRVTRSFFVYCYIYPRFEFRSKEIVINGYSLDESFDQCYIFLENLL